MSFPIFKEFHEFQESRVFQEFPELSFLSYYSDFKLIICNSCKIGINYFNINIALNKYYKAINNY